MPADFYLSALPEPVTLLGLKLRPYSLGHVLLLHRVESAFVCGGNVTYADLALSVFICAQTYREAEASFSDPKLPRFMRKWHDKLTGDPWWRPRLRRRKFAVIDLKAKSEAFAKYIEDGSRSPYYSFDPSKTGGAQLESVHAVRLILMAKTTLTEAELLDRPWGLCLHDYIGLQAMDDQVKLCEKSSVHDALELANRLQETLNKRNGSIQPNS